MFRWERIKEEGLKPRSETGVNAAYGAAITSAPPANPDHVYFSATFNATPRFAAFDANKEDYEHGSVPVVLRIDSKGLDYNKLKADVDVRSSDWKSSFHNINTIAYAGNVSPKYIELFRVWNFKTNEWEMPGSQIEPKDWLAQQILHPDQYKNIDDSTAKYKWAKVGRK